MNNQNIAKFDLLPEFLKELFNVELDDVKPSSISKIKVLNINQQELAKELKNFWTYLYNKCLNFSLIQEEYIEKFRPWKEKYDSFIAVKDDQDLLIFLEKYFSIWMKLSFKSKDITKKEIYDIINHEKPSFFRSIPTQMGSYKNLLIFENDSFRLTAHLKLKEYKTNTYSLVIVFSFWFENIFDSWEANLEVINDNYKNLMIAYDVIKKLKSLRYEESYLNVEETSSGNKFIRSPYTITENPLHPSNNLILEILSDNSIRLFEELVSHIYIIDDVIERFEEQNNLSPYSYFENLTIELKQFLLKGKELFLKAEDLLQKSTISREKTIIPGEKEIEEMKFSFEQIIGFFKDALEKDKGDDTILPEEKGFRTQNQIFDEYKDNIDGSKPTFYYYFDNLKLESFLEVRNKRGKGGGKECRYKEIKVDSDQILYESGAIEKPPEKGDLSTERIEIQEALTCYNYNDLEYSIQIFSHVLKSEELESDLILYTTCLYYLGRSYFKKGDYKKALEAFNKAHMKNQSLYNVKYSLIESYLHIQDYTNALKLVNEIISGVREIIQSSEINLNLDYIFARPIDAESLDIIHPEITEKDMFSNWLITLNKPTIAVQFVHTPISERRNEIVNIVNNNITSIQILYKKYLSSLFLKLEILRRSFFREVLEKKEEQISKIIDEFLLYCREIRNDSIVDNRLSFEDYRGYISYFKGVLKIFKFPTLKKKISDEFPNLEYQTVFPKNYYLWKFDEFYYFLNYINEILFKDFKRDNSILHLLNLSQAHTLRGKFSNPDLKAEYYFIEAYINLYYLLDDRIKSEEQLNISFDPTAINTREEIFRQYDEYHSRWLGFRHPKSYLDMAEKADNYAKKHKFKDLTKYVKNVLETTKEKVEIIETFRLERRNKDINRKLEILSKSYKDISEDITLSFQEKHIKGFRYFIHFKIIREIERILREKTGNLTFKLHLFNPELNKDIIDALSKELIHRESVEGRTRAIFIVKMELEESKADSSIIAKLTHMRDLKKESGAFDENLDKINWLIYNAISINIDSFTIRLDPKDLEKYKNYFDKDFKIEYENKYFEFLLLQNWENDEITIQINKF